MKTTKTSVATPTRAPRENAARNLKARVKAALAAPRAARALKAATRDRLSSVAA